MRVLVTGSTGLLGSNLVFELLAQGHQVRALVRSREKGVRRFGGRPVELVEGDLSNIAGFAGALAGCDAVFHTAAFFREYYQPGNHADSLEALNVQATVTLAKEAQTHGVKRFFHIGSGGTIGINEDGSPGDENTPPPAIAASNGYFSSKVRASAALDAARASLGIEIVEILPGWMFGPFDEAPTAAGQLVKDFLDNRLPGVIDGGGTAVDARDVAKGMVNALSKEQLQHRYLIAGTFVTLPEIGRLLGEVSGIRRRLLTLPYPVAIAFATVVQAWSKLTKRPNVLTVDGLRVMRAKLHHNSQRAQRELGVSFRPFRETLRDTVAWYQKQG
jgi:dihydroflavonol-4-reductase